MKKIFYVVLLFLFYCTCLTGSGSTLITEGIIEGFQLPSGVAVDSSNNIYVADTGNHLIKKFNANKQMTLSFDGTANGGTNFLYPQAVVVDESNYIYIADTGNHRVAKYDFSGNFVMDFGTGRGQGDTQFSYPRDVKIYNDMLYILDSGNHRITVWDLYGNYSSKIENGQGYSNAQLNNPYAFSIGTNSYLYIMNTYNYRVEILSNANGFINKFGSIGTELENDQFLLPKGIAVSSDKIYVADTDNGRIKIFDLSGNLLNTYGNIGSAWGAFKTPEKMAVSENNNDIKLYVVDPNQNRLTIFNISDFIDNVSISNTHFSPNNDGSKDTAIISYDLSSHASSLFFAIYNTNGQIMTNIRKYVSFGNGPYPDTDSFEWNGYYTISTNYLLAEEGKYNYVIKGVNDYGYSPPSITGEILLDLTSPVFNIEEIPVANSSQRTILYSISDNLSSLILDLSIKVINTNSGEILAVLLNGINLITTNYSITWDGLYDHDGDTNTSKVAVTNGTSLRYIISGCDMAGNYTTNFIDSIMDYAGPDILDVSVYPNPIKSGNEPANIKYTLNDLTDDDIFVSLVIKDSNYNDIKVIKNNVIESIGSYSNSQWYGKNTTNSNILSGYYKFIIQAKDAMSNISYYTGEIGIDNIPPETTLLYDNSVNLSSSGVLLLSGVSLFSFQTEDEGPVTAPPIITKYRYDNGSFNEYSSSFSIFFDVNDEKTLQYYSIDDVGNIEKTNGIIVKARNYFAGMEYKFNVAYITNIADSKRGSIPYNQFGTGELCDEKAGDLQFFSDFVGFSSESIAQAGDYLEIVFDLKQAYKLDRFILDAWQSSNKYIRSVEVLAGDYSYNFESYGVSVFEKGTGSGEIWNYDIGCSVIEKRYIKLKIKVESKEANGIGLRLHEVRAYGVNASGGIKGLVTKAESMLPVYNAFVCAVNSNNVNYGGRSDADGTYTLDGLIDGIYDVFACENETGKKVYVNNIAVSNGSIVSNVNIMIDEDNLLSGKKYYAEISECKGHTHSGFFDYEDSKRNNIPITLFGPGELTDGKGSPVFFKDYIGWWNDDITTVTNLDLYFDLGEKKRYNRIVLKGYYNYPFNEYLKRIEVFQSDDNLTYEKAGFSVFGQEIISNNNYQYILSGFQGNARFIQLKLDSASITNLFTRIHEISAYQDISNKSVISGKVLYSDGAIVSNAYITAVHNDGDRISVLSSTKGLYSLNLLHQGNYHVYASGSIDSSPVVKSNISINSGAIKPDVNFIIPVTNSGNSPEKLFLISCPINIPGGGITAEIMGQIKDSNGKDIQQSGIAVFLSNNNSAVGDIPTGPFYTDSLGQIKLNFISSNNYGTAIIHSTNLTGSIAITVSSNSATDVVLIPATNMMSIIESINVIGRLYNNGSPVNISGVRVSVYEITGLGTFQSNYYYTDSSGEFTAVFNAGNYMGTGILQANSLGIQGHSTNIIINSLQGTNIIVTAEPNELIEGETDSLIKIKVTDKLGNKVVLSNLIVELSGYGSGSLSPSDIINLGSTGEGYAVFNPGTQQGNITITGTAVSNIPNGITLNSGQAVIKIMDDDNPGIDIVISKYITGSGSMENDFEINSGSEKGLSEYLENWSVIGQDSPDEVHSHFLNRVSDSKVLVFTNNEEMKYEVLINEVLIENPVLEIIQDSESKVFLTYTNNNNIYSGNYTIPSGLFSDGIAYLKASCVDLAYNRKVQVKKFIIDNYLPQLYVSLSNNILKKDDVIKIEVESSELLADLTEGKDSGLIITVTEPDAETVTNKVIFNNISYVSYYTMSGTNDGIGSTMIYGRDCAGHIVEKNTNFILDNTIPDAYVESDITNINGQNYARSLTNTYTIYASDTNEVELIEVLIDNMTNYIDYETVKPIKFNTEGTHTINYRVTDKADNIYDFSEYSVVIDASAPDINLYPSETLYQDSFSFYASSNVAYQLTASDSYSGLDYTEYSVDTNNYLLYSGSTNIPGFSDNTLHIISYYAKDKLGHTSSTQIFRVTSDNLIPNAEILDPSIISINISGIYTFKGRAYDENIIQYQLSCSMYLSNNYSMIVTNLIIPVTNGLLYNVNTTNFEEGKYTFKLTVIDKAGYTNEDTVDVLVDNEYPQINLLSISEDQDVQGDDIIYYIQFQHILSEESTVSINITDNSNNFINQVYYGKFLSDTTNTNTWYEKNQYNNLVEPGVYHFEISAQDNAGNISTITTNLEITRSDNPSALSTYSTPLTNYSLSNIHIYDSMTNNFITTLPAQDTIFVWDGRKADGDLTNAGNYTAKIKDIYYNILLSSDTVSPVITNYSISTSKIVPQNSETVDIKYLTEEYCEYTTIEILNEDNQIIQSTNYKGSASFHFNGLSYSGKTNIFTWDGRDNTTNAGYAESGDYTVRIYGRDMAGNEREVKSLNISINSAPEIYNVMDGPYDPFSPVIGQESIISYRISEPADVTLQIFNSYNNLIETILSNYPSTNDFDYEFSWDGKNNNNQYVPNGVYAYKIHAIDFDNIYSSTNTGTVEVMNSFEITVLSLNGEFFTPNGNPSDGPDQVDIAYHIPDQVFVEIKVKDSMGTAVRQVLPATNDSGLKTGGEYDFSWDGKDDNNELVDEGKYYIEIVISRSGQSDSEIIEVSKYDTPQIALITSPSDQKIVEGDVSVYGSAVDLSGAGLDKYEVWIAEISGQTNFKKLVDINNNNVNNNISEDELIRFNSLLYKDANYLLKLKVINKDTGYIEYYRNFIVQNHKDAPVGVVRNDDSGKDKEWCYYFKTDKTEVHLSDLMGHPLEVSSGGNIYNAITWNASHTQYGYGTSDSMKIFSDNIDISKVRMFSKNSFFNTNDNDNTTYTFTCINSVYLVKTNGIPWQLVPSTNSADIENGLIPVNSDLCSIGVYGTPDGFRVYVNNEDVTNYNYKIIAMDLSDSTGWPDGISTPDVDNKVIGIDPERGRIKFFDKESGTHSYSYIYSLINNGFAEGSIINYVNHAVVGGACSSVIVTNTNTLTGYESSIIFNELNSYTADFNINGYTPVAKDLSATNWQTSVYINTNEVGIDVVRGKFKFHPDFASDGSITSIYNELAETVNIVIPVGPVYEEDEETGEDLDDNGNGQGNTNNSSSRVAFYFKEDKGVVHLTDKQGNLLEVVSGGVEDQANTWVTTNSNYGYGTDESLRIYENGFNLADGLVRDDWINDAEDNNPSTYVFGSKTKKQLFNTNNIQWIMIKTNKDSYNSNEIPEGVNLLDYGFYNSKNGVTVYINNEDVVARKFMPVDDYRKLSREKQDYYVFYPDSANLIDAFDSLAGITSFALEFYAISGMPQYVDVIDKAGRKWRRVEKTQGRYRLDINSQESIKNMVPVAVDLSDETGWPDTEYNGNYNNVLGIDVNNGRIKMFSQKGGTHFYTSDVEKLIVGSSKGEKGSKYLSSTVGNVFTTPIHEYFIIPDQFARKSDYNWQGYEVVAMDLSSSGWDITDNVDEGKVGIDVVLGRFKFNLNEGRYGIITSDYNYYVPSADPSNCIAFTNGDGCYTFDINGYNLHLTDRYGKGLEDMGMINDDDSPLSWIADNSNFGYSSDNGTNRKNLNGVTVYIDDGSGPKDVSLNSFNIEGGTTGPVTPVVADLSSVSWKTDDNVATNTVAIDVVSGRFKFYNAPTGIVSSKYNYKVGPIILTSDDNMVTVIIPVDAIDAYTELSIIPTALPTDYAGNSYSLNENMYYMYNLTAIDLHNEPMLSFNSPVTMIFNYDDTGMSQEEEEALQMYLFNPELEIWEVATEFMPFQIDTVNNTIKISTIHFSSYGLLDNSEGPEPPVLNPIASPNRNDVILLSGTGEHQTSVEIYTNNGLYSDVSLINNIYNFSMPLVLNEGEYIINAYTVDYEGNRSDKSDDISLTVDRTTPDISGFYTKGYLTPNQDGLNETISFNFNSDEMGSGFIEIKSVSSELIYIMSFNLNKGFNEVIWNGKNVNGEIVDDGSYFYNIICYDQAGNRGADYNTGMIYLKKSLPMIQVSSIFTNDIIKDNMKIKGTVNDDMLEYYKVYYKNQDNYIEFYNKTDVVINNYIVNTSIPEMNGAGYIKISAEDIFNNKNEVIKAVEFDNQNPNLEVIGLTNGSILSGIRPVYVNVIDEHNISIQMILKSGESFEHEEILADIIVNQKAYNGVLNIFDTSKYEDGDYNIVIIAKDVVNNISQKEYNLSINNSILDVSIVSISNKLFSPNNDGEKDNVNIKYLLSHDNINVKIEVLNSNNEAIRTLYTNNQDKGTHSAFWNGLDDDSNRVNDGYYKIRVFIEDQAGNETDEEIIECEVDNGISMVNISAVLFIHNGQIRVLADSVDPGSTYLTSEYGHGDFYINGSFNDKNIDKAVLGYSDAQNLNFIEIASWSANKENDQELIQWNSESISDGVYILKLELQDKAGNISKEEVIMKIDNTLPEVTLANPINNLWYKETIDIHADITENNCAEYKIYIGEGIEPENYTLIAVDTISGNNILYNLNSSEYDGIYTIKVEVLDHAGNKESDTVSINLDNKDPEILISNVYNRMITNDSVNPVIQINDINLISSEIKIEHNNDVVQITSNSYLSINLNNPGTYIIEVSAEDIVNHSAHKEIQFNIGADIPVPVLMSPFSNSITNINAIEFVWDFNSDIFNPDYFEIEIDGIIKQSFDASYLSDLNLVDGLHYWKVRAVDEWNNKGDWSVLWDFLVDTTPPDVSVSGIATGKYYNHSITPIIQIEDENIGEVFTALNDEPYQSGTMITEEGEYQLKVYAKDIAENESISTIDFGIDRITPEIIIKEVEHNSTYYNDVKPKVEIIETHPKLGWTNLLFSRVTNNLAYSNIPFYNGAVISNEGRYELQAGMEDKAGNITSRTAGFKIKDFNPDDVLIFRADYNTNSNADYAKGDKKNHGNGKITSYNQGHNGEALISHIIGNSHYGRYKSDKNIDEKQGTIMLWVKPFWQTANYIGKDQGRYLFSLYENKSDKKYTINFVVFKNKGTTAQIRSVDKDKNEYINMFSVDTNSNENERWYKDGFNRWTHLALSWDADSGSIKIYINGELKGHYESDKWTPYNMNKNSWIKVGDSPKEMFTEFFGYMDRFKIYNLPLKSKHIKEIYNKELKDANNNQDHNHHD